MQDPQHRQVVGGQSEEQWKMNQKVQPMELGQQEQ
jgi:hypothetical protein